MFALLLAPPARGLFHRAIVRERRPVASTRPPTAEDFVDDPQPSQPNASGEAAAPPAGRGRRGGGPRGREGEARGDVAGGDRRASFAASPPYDVLRAFPIAGSGRHDRHAAACSATASVLPAERSAGGARARRRTRTRAGDGRHESRREQALHVRRPRAGPALVRHRSRGCATRPRTSSTPSTWPRMWKATGADEPAAALQRVAARAGLRLSLRLGRGADASRRRPPADARRGARLRDPVRLRPLRSRPRGQRDLHGRQRARPGGAVARR